MTINALKISKIEDNVQSLVQCSASASTELLWNDNKWKMNRPSLFAKNSKVYEFAGKEEVNALKDPNSLSFVYIYHPDCPYCKKSAPEWEQFAQDFEESYRGSVMKVGAINLSDERNRKDPLPGQKFGSFLDAIGPIKTVPTIKLFKDGQEIKYDN